MTKIMQLSYKRNQYVYKQGERASKIYIVADGYFQVSRKLAREVESDGDQPTALMQYIRPDVQA